MDNLRTNASGKTENWNPVLILSSSKSVSCLFLLFSSVLSMSFENNVRVGFAFSFRSLLAVILQITHLSFQGCPMACEKQQSKDELEVSGYKSGAEIFFFKTVAEELSMVQMYICVELQTQQSGSE